MFHLNCFTCMMCNKQLSTGEELYIIDENKFVCKEDYLNNSNTAKENSLHSGEGARPEGCGAGMCPASVSSEVSPVLFSPFFLLYFISPLLSLYSLFSYTFSHLCFYSVFSPFSLSLPLSHALSPLPGSFLSPSPAIGISTPAAPGLTVTRFTLP